MGDRCRSHQSADTPDTKHHRVINNRDSMRCILFTKSSSMFCGRAVCRDPIPLQTPCTHLFLPFNLRCSVLFGTLNSFQARTTPITPLVAASIACSMSSSFQDCLVDYLTYFFTILLSERNRQLSLAQPLKPHLSGSEYTLPLQITNNN